MLCAQPAVLHAQLLDPRVAEFTASSDHNATASDGTPLVTGYDLAFYQTGAAQPFQTQSLGKPVPDQNGLIRYALSGLPSMPSAGIVYEARVVAVGPGGSAASGPSNTFLFSSACSYTVSPLTVTVPSTGGVATSSVGTGTTCNWTASTTTSWLTIASGANGVGNGAVSYSAAPNATTAQRTGTLVIAGRSVTVNQPASDDGSGGGGGGGGCTYELTPLSQTIPATGGTGSVTVTTAPTCTWSATRSGSWLTMQSAMSGTGSGTLSFSVPPNTASTVRSASITVAGHTASISQSAAACTFSVTPTSLSPAAAASTGTLAIATGNGCAWSATRNGTWITLTSATTGSGSGSLSYSIAANTSTTERSGSITVGGQLIPVVQPGTACSFTVQPSALAIPAGGGSAGGNVTTATGCSWTTSNTASWLTVTAGRSGSGPFTVTATPNPTTAPRLATLAVAGRTVEVTQGVSSNTCLVRLSPTSLTVDGNTNSATIAVTTAADCTWRATSGAAWLTITSGLTGTGSGVITVRPARNPPSTRSTTLTVNGEVAAVVQVSGNLPKAPKGVRFTND